MFTIKCDKCGAEDKIVLNDRGTVFECEVITLYPEGHDGGIGVSCNKCDNEIVEDI